jgi:prepilin-type N-terminal cleavage/methylation domain-containing protein
MPVPTESCRQSDVIWENRYRLVSDVKGRASYGFTVVELIVVLVLIAIATIIGMQMAGDWTTSYQFDSFNLGLQAAVETARANAMALQKSVKLSMREAGDSDPVEERRFAQEEYFV